MSILADHTPIPAQNLPKHLAWCDPRTCATYPDTADELLVVHRAVVLDEPLSAVPRAGRLVVDVVRGDVVRAPGGELLAHDSAAVRVRGIGDEDELTPDQATRLARAVAAAADIAGGAR